MTTSSSTSGYDITKKGNTITILNTANEIIYVEIYTRRTCNGEDSELIKQETLGPNDSQTFKFPIKDGLYNVEIYNDNFSESYTIPVFDNLLKSLVEDIEDYFCGECGCCANCEGEEDKRAELLLKLMSFYIVNRKYVSGFVDKAMECLECSILEANFCYLYSEMISDNKENKQLYDNVIATFYIAFYMSDFIFSDENLDEKYQYDKIKNCILAQGINTTCIEEKIKDMAQFNTNFRAYVNLPPSTVGNYTSTQDNRAALVITPAMFTTATTPVYADPENDAAQAVRVDSLPTGGATLKLDGVAVIAGQVIVMTDIAANKLTLTGPNSDALVNSTFNFSVRDSGSMKFSS